MDGSALTSLKRICLKSIHRNRLPMSEYKLVFSLSCDCLRDLHLFTVKSERTVRLKMDLVNCVSLPSDFLSLIKIGCAINGRFWSFTNDEGIIIPQTIVNGVPTLNGDLGEGQTRVEGKFNSDGSQAGWSFSAYTSSGGVNNYYLKFDYENRRIILDNIDRGDVILVYKSNGISTSGETLVPVIYEEALLSFIDWKRSLGERNMSWAQKNEQSYYEECHKLQFLESPSLTDLFDVIRSTYSQGIKR